MANQFASGRDEYPKDLTAAYSLLVHYKTPVNAKRPQDTGAHGNTQGNPGNGNGGGQQQRNYPNPPINTPTSAGSAMTFAQGGGTTAPVSSITSSPNPPVPAPVNGTITTGALLVQYAVMMAQTALQINPWSILLDSQSAISVFNNKAMLTNARSTPHVVHAITNGGFQDSKMVGEFPNLGNVYYNPNSIANILSLADVCKRTCVTMDTSISLSLDVHQQDGTIMSFVKHPSGLYVYTNNNPNKRVSAYTLL